MLWKRVPVLWAFAGGCLSSAAILGLWQVAAERSRSATLPVVDAREAFLAVLNRLNSIPAGERSIESATPGADSTSLPSAVTSAGAGANPDSTGVSRPYARTADAVDAAPTHEAGSSVADVLARLEADYRRKLTVVESRDAASSTSRAASEPASADAATAVQQRAAAPPRPLEVASSTPPPERPPAQEAPVAGPAPSVPNHLRPSEVPPVTPPRLEAEVAFAPQTSVRGRVVYMGDVQQNIYVGDVHQRSIYQAQQLAMLQQQLTMIQYLQLLTLTSRFQPALTPVPANPPVAPAPGRHVSAFPTSLTNTDNPWGFDFPPTVLVR